MRIRCIAAAVGLFVLVGAATTVSASQLIHRDQATANFANAGTALIHHKPWHRMKPKHRDRGRHLGWLRGKHKGWSKVR